MDNGCFECNNVMHNNCVVFTTHKLNVDIINYLLYIKDEIRGIMDLLVLYDNSVSPIIESDYSDFNFCFFNSEKLNGFFHQNNKLLPNTLMPLIECSNKYHYKHYLLMENDIILNGSFRSFVEKINIDDNVDYMHIASDIEGGPENHWPIKYIKNNPFDNLYFSWCQLFYISRKLLHEAEMFIKVNDSFHYEFLLPTIAYNGKFIVRQFENFGYNFQLSWGPVEKYEDKYIYERKKNTFYHPIKNLGIVDFVHTQKIE